MGNPKSVKIGIGVLLSAGCAVWLVGNLISCGAAPSPIPVVGPGQLGNDPPTLTFLEPSNNTTLGQGDPFLIRWTDRDRDDNAKISFLLENTTDGSDRILLVQGIDENDLTGPDTFTVGTTLIPEGTYNVLGIIDDGTNQEVSAYALWSGAAVNQRVVVTIVGPGEGPQSQPPTIAVTEPSFNLSVAQDDTLTVSVQPTLLAPDPSVPFDPDSRVTLYILLDTDLDPNNDDPANPDPSRVIVLLERTIEAGEFSSVSFQIPIDLSVIPPRPNGESYFIRATADDRTNPRVHQYAVGTINVVQLAAGLVDLHDIGRTKSGAKFYGFNPGANLGSTVASVGDFDADGVNDFMLVARFGNPRNLGTVGEAYLVYGQTRSQLGAASAQTAGNRFGGAIPINSVGETISGTIFEAPPMRAIADLRMLPGIPRTEGIVDVSFISDLSGDGRPEILFGLPHVHGAFEGMDFDPSDEDLSRGDQTIDREIVFRRNFVTIQTGQETPIVRSLLWSGIEEVTISSAQPNTTFGSSDQITWMDSGTGSREWTLIKFGNVLEMFPDNPRDIDITTVQATLEFRVFNQGGSGTLHVALTNFDERETFNSYAGGAAPQPGIDYINGGDSVGAVDGQTAGPISIDVSDVVLQLVDGELAGVGNELRFIIVPDPVEGEDQAAVRSSEYANNEEDRPTLRIEYTRLNFFAALGCYPDDLVNNMTDTQAQDPNDVQYYAGGMVIYFNSENRDIEPRLGDIATRLESTAVALELVGQEGQGWRLDGEGTDQAGVIAVRADDGQDTNRIAGARFTAGAFDFIDHRFLNQPAREGLFGQSVASIGDLNNDELDEIIISAPSNERYREDLLTTFGFESTHYWSTRFEGSIAVIPGNDYNDQFWREKTSAEDGSTTIPVLDQHQPGHDPFGRCTSPFSGRHMDIPPDTFEVFAEDVNDMLGGASSAGDFNQDGLDDILCGAYLNDNRSAEDAGAVYILYGRNILGDFDLTNADDSILRAPMLRVRGVKTGDQIGWRQTSGRDVNGDRIDDVFFSSPRADFGGVVRTTCAVDANGDGLTNSADLSILLFNDCESNFGDYVFFGDPCKAYDYDNDTDIDADDRCIFCCLSDDCDPAAECVLGQGVDCCENMVDNGLVGIIFGGVFLNGDRDISQLANPISQELPGAIFYGSGPGHRAGMDISSAGDFNQDGFGDILIATPGEIWRDSAGRNRLGVVYLIFGGTHLINTKWNLRDVGTDELPGVVFFSPYVAGRPNEAAPLSVAPIGDINDDGFDDIAIGNPNADFIDLSFPQGPDAPGSDAAVGRRRDVGDVYIIYGNNFGANRASP